MDQALIIGVGEVGGALAEVLSKAHHVSIRDLHQDTSNGAHYDFLHVCFPYTDDFCREVAQYQVQYEPSVTVIHSTVPVGTSTSLGAVHSPVIGLHPNLGPGLLTFTKFVGGKQASTVARHLSRAGIRCYLTDKAETTELLKLLCTTRYGLDIEWTKHVKELCDKHGVPFEAYTLWTQMYNTGYQELGYPEYARSNLVPVMGRIGGHCVLPNLALIDGDEFTELIRTRNQ